MRAAISLAAITLSDLLLPTRIVGVNCGSSNAAWRSRAGPYAHNSVEKGTFCDAVIDCRGSNNPFAVNRQR